MTTETYPTVQAIINRAFDKGPSFSTFDDFIDGLDALERRVVLIGKLNYQVENGGFLQWCENGYVRSAGSVMRALAWLGTPTAMRVMEMVSIVNREYQEYDQEVRRARRFERDDESDYPMFDDWDNEYYAGLGAQLLADLEAKVSV